MSSILSSKRYENAHDVQLRLQNCVVKYNDRPVFVGQNIKKVQGVENELMLDVFDILTQKWFDFQVHSSDENLEVKAMPLGYINQNHTALYIMRQPCRRQRQGLCSENCWYYDPVTTVISKVQTGTLKSLAFGSMIMGTYPTLDEALDIMKRSGMHSHAIGRKIAISTDEIGLTKLVYFTTVIGVYNRSAKTFFIPERFEHYIPVVSAYNIPCSVEA